MVYLCRIIRLAYYIARPTIHVFAQRVEFRVFCCLAGQLGRKINISLRYQTVVAIYNSYTALIT